MNGKAILVQKFGGTSVATAGRRQLLIGHVRAALTGGARVAVVVSAMGRRGEPYATDTLLDLLRSGGTPVDPADYDLIFTCGEAIAAAVVSHEMKLSGVPAKALTSYQAGIVTNGHAMEAEILRVEASRLLGLLEQGVVPVITGGQGVAEESRDFTTLGRGGSDTSGVALGVALGAGRVEIFTDVDGVAVADPRLVPKGPLLPRVSYDAMSEMARFGAGVLHPRAISTARAAGLPVVVRSTFGCGPGTVVHGSEDGAALVGMAWMPAVATLFLEPGCAGQNVREGWERRFAVVTIEDAASGRIAAGSRPDQAARLDAALAGARVQPPGPKAACAWVSLVGSGLDLQLAFERVRSALASDGTDILAWEADARRCTLIVDASVGERAARLSYETAFSPGAAWQP